MNKPLTNKHVNQISGGLEVVTTFAARTQKVSAISPGHGMMLHSLTNVLLEPEKQSIIKYKEKKQSATNQTIHLIKIICP